MAASAATGPGRGYKLSLTFGLVSIPIKYAPMTEATSPVSAKTLCPEHQLPLNQGDWVCSRGTPSEHEVARDTVIKGYPHPDDKNQLVVVDPSVIEEFAESRSGVASIERIVDFSTIDPAYFDKVYLVWPGEGGAAAEQSFDLFATVLRNESKAAVTTAVMSKQTRTVVFRWSDEFGCLVAHVCRFSSQIRLGNIETVKAVAERRVPPEKAALALAKQILDTLEGEFDPSEVEDTWTPLMQDAIRQAAGGKAVKTATKAKAVAPAGDLMAALTASLASTKADAPAKRTRKKTTA